MHFFLQSGENPCKTSFVSEAPRGSTAVMLLKLLSVIIGLRTTLAMETSKLGRYLPIRWCLVEMAGQLHQALVLGDLGLPPTERMDEAFVGAGPNLTSAMQALTFPFLSEEQAIAVCARLAETPTLEKSNLYSNQMNEL